MWYLTLLALAILAGIVLCVFKLPVGDEEMETEHDCQDYRSEDYKRWIRGDE